ncbi:uncharacterized protein LOC134214032 [Armigeres subalbatus]|uniref:uncharacterized protein LOC134214032 n=1 Tax=Armigeres subalbatus TaxID=124917 RepID=UPI002ED5E2EE
MIQMAKKVTQVLIGNASAMAHKNQLRVMKDSGWQPRVVLTRGEPDSTVEDQTNVEREHAMDFGNVDDYSEDPRGSSTNRKRRHHEGSDKLEMTSNGLRRSKRRRKEKKDSDYIYE